MSCERNPGSEDNYCGAKSEMMNLPIFTYMQNVQVGQYLLEVPLKCTGKLSVFAYSFLQNTVVSVRPSILQANADHLCFISSLCQYNELECDYIEKQQNFSNAQWSSLITNPQVSRIVLFGIPMVTQVILCGLWATVFHSVACMVRNV